MHQATAKHDQRQKLEHRSSYRMLAWLLLTLVEVHGIALDMRYATADNFTHRAVYDKARCLLRPSVAVRLMRVETALAKDGLGLKLYDCYRPLSVQQKFWALVPDPRYVAKVSRHNRGAAVDVTLVDKAGVELPMPTAFDDFSARAHRDADVPEPQKTNRARLEKAMAAEGFVGLPTEWWHFDAPDWRDYPVSDEPL